LLRLSELEMTARSNNALANPIKPASFPLMKKPANFDFTLAPVVRKITAPELSGGKWIDQHHTPGVKGWGNLLQ